jgi:hypothetical protein
MHAIHGNGPCRKCVLALGVVDQASGNIMRNALGTACNDIGFTSGQLLNGYLHSGFSLSCIGELMKFGKLSGHRGGSYALHPEIAVILMHTIGPGGIGRKGIPACRPVCQASGQIVSHEFRAAFIYIWWVSG